MNRHILIAAVLAAAVSACSHAAAIEAPHAASHWSYAGESGSDRWGYLSPAFAACASGQRQSPIDIAATGAAAVTTQYSGTSTELVHNGHTIQLNAGPGNTLNVAEGAFELLQMHFHSPSEHLIAGRRYPLEAHFVHRNAGGELAVVGLLFREGAPDAGISAMWKVMPPHAGEAVTLNVPLKTLWQPAGAFASYDGSLTTPPCDEGVRWFVAEAAATVSRDQVAAFVAAVGENARPVQPLNGRTVRLP